MDGIIEVDVLVIGAGICGISAAKFYLDMHPASQLVVLDRDTHVGGVWNARRGYDGFWTQWTLGLAEFSDQAMPRPPNEDVYFGFFKAKHTRKYLENYVDQHSFAGKKLSDRICLSTEVRSVVKSNGKWSVSAKDLTTGQLKNYQASKLMMAAGLSSIPNMPSIPGKETFLGKVFHQNDFGSSHILASSDVKAVTVLGAGKSSADMVYECVKAGKEVSWVLKETNTTGPGFLVDPKGAGPYKNAFEIAATRFAGSLSPSVFVEENWWTRFLHSTSYGLKLTTAFWGFFDKDVKRAANFEREGTSGLEKLIPHTPLFWQNCTGGLLHHPDFFDNIAEKARIYVGDIDRLEKDKLILQTGEEIPSDVILCGTGWHLSLQFFSNELRQELGLPHPINETTKEEAHWTELEAAADIKVTSRFPMLANPPPHYHKPVTETPYRLYRGIVPISESSSPIDHSIVFIGQIGVGNYFMTGECQAMWATAYLDGKLNLPTREEQENTVAMFTSWCKRRYLSHGDEATTITLESGHYNDLLLEDLGLKSHRKGWFKDFWAVQWASDYKGLRWEFMKRFGYEDGKEN